MNWIMLYRAMYLNTPKLFINGDDDFFSHFKTHRKISIWEGTKPNA